MQVEDRPTRTSIPERDHVRTDRRIGALDGLRAVAVAAVIAYHQWPGALPGGFLGVDLFMVLSGFLITGLLLDERVRRGAIRLGAFWGRRFRRLVPALLTLLAAVTVWVHVQGPAALRPTVHSQGLASLLYVGNWKLVRDGVSYAALAKPPSPLLHLWSLAVEEQFYLVWPPIVVVVLYAARGRRWPLAMVAGAGAVASAVAMAVMFTPTHDPLRLYYGTDTRAQTFLIGALTALAARHVAASTLRRALGVVGPIALGLVGVAFVWAPAPVLLYRGGFAVFALVAALAVAAATVPGPVTQVLNRPALCLIGRVSYGIYLWHWPIIVLVTRDSTGLTGIALVFARAALIAGATTASWVLVERPFSRLAPRPAAAVGPLMVGASASVLVLLPAQQIIAYANVRTDKLPAPIVLTPAVDVASGPAPSTTTGPVPTNPAPTNTTAPASTPPPTLVPPQPGTVMIVGDSGMYDATPALAAGFAAAGWRVVSTSFPGVGLTNPGMLQDWANTVDQYRPTLTVVMLGGWDLAFVAKHGDAAYQAVVDDAVRIYTGRAGKVLWLSMLPGGGTPGRPADRFFQVLPTRYPGEVDYFDIAPALTAPDGTWPRTLAGQLVRKPDGWHLCPAGADLLAHEVLGHLALDRPGWDSGLWRIDRRYNDPPGGCRA